MSAEQDEPPLPGPQLPPEVLAARRAVEARRPAEARAALLRFLHGGPAGADEQRGLPPPSEATRLAAEVAGKLGLVSEALALWRGLLELLPRDPTVWQRMAELHEERGDLSRGRRCRERARLLAPGPKSAHPPRKPEAPEGLVDLRYQPADVARFVSLFTGREDTHARQWAHRSSGRSGYSPIAEPLGPAAARAHLDGRMTLGSYLLREDETVTFCVVDLDLHRGAVEAARGDGARVAELARRVARAGDDVVARVRELGLEPLYEDSGYKGRHLWVFFTEPLPAGQALGFGKSLLRALELRDPLLHLEYFPKQARRTGKGLGNLVKLPLGIHQVSHRRSWLLDDEGRVDPEPLARLRRVRRTSSTALEAARGRLDALDRPWQVGEAPAEGALQADEAEQAAKVCSLPTRTRPPKPPAPPWHEEDFAKDPQIGKVLAGCAVLARLVQRGCAGDALTHDELVSLRHTLGHCDRGPQAVNFVQERVPGVGEEQRMGRRLRGMPASCANLQRKAPGLVRQVDCACDFGGRRPIYAHPLLHLQPGPPALELVPVEGEAATPIPLRPSHEQEDEG